MLLRDTVHQISRGESAAAGLIASQPRALTPRGMSGGPYHVTTLFLFLSRDIKHSKFNQYLSTVLTLLNVSNSIFRKLVLFWMWRHHGRALWRRGGGAWHNGLLLTTASNVNYWADVANHVTWLWQAGDTENFERRITGMLWIVELPNHGKKKYQWIYMYDVPTNVHYIFIEVYQTCLLNDIFIIQLWYS